MVGLYKLACRLFKWEINPFGDRFEEIRASNLVKIDVQGRIHGDTARSVNVNGFPAVWNG